MKNRYLLIALLSFCFSAFAQNKNISQGIAFDGEPYLIMNPSNSSHLVVLWMGYDFGKPLGIKSRVSFDAGKNWSAAKLLPHLKTSHQSADPSMAFDKLGNLFACYVDYRKSPDSGGIVVVRSTDGGLNWGSPVKVIDAYADGNKKPIDRPWLIANPANNHLYITSKPAPWIPIPCRPYFMASTNSGINWTPWRYIDTAGYLVGDFIQAPMAMHTVGSDGVLHILYPSYKASQNPLPGFIHAKSTSDGASFLYNPAFNQLTGAADTNAKMGYRLISDPTDAQHLAIIYAGGITGDLDVYVTESYNGGSSWGSAQRANDDAAANGKMQELVWADFDTDADLLLAWRDRRNAGNGYSTASEIWAAVRWKDSSNFSKNFRISDSLTPYHSVLGGNGNDFMNVVMRNDTLNAVWGEVRSGKLAIYYQRTALKTGQTGAKILIDFTPAIPVSIYPNPSSDRIWFDGAKVSYVKFFDPLGKLISEGRPGNDRAMSVRLLKPGQYNVQLTVENKIYWLKFRRD